MKKTESAEGIKTFYFCNGKNCPCKAYILCLPDSFRASVFMSADEHGHENQAAKTGIDVRIKTKIDALYKDGVIKPNKIIRSLNNMPGFDELPKFTKLQLSNYLKKLKERLFGSYTISLSDVREYCENNSPIPEDLNKVYVCAYEIFENDRQRASTTGLDATIRIFFTTGRLLKFASNDSSHIACDATYKLIWQGYPTIMVGSTDRGCHYHPYGFVVATNEETLDYVFMF